MLEAQGLTKNYGTFTAATDVTFEVQRGEIFGLLGSNGAGKTTVLKIFATLLRPDRGSALIDGVDVVKEPLKARALFGYLPELPALYDHLTGGEFLTLIGTLRGMEEDEIRQKTTEIAKVFQMDRELKVEAGTLSKGMRQKLAVSSALFHNPPVLILDEPTTGLDPRFQKALKEQLRSFSARGGTALLSTHLTEAAEQLCRRVAIMDGGVVKAVGSPQELKGRFSCETLEDVFVAAVES